MNKSRSLLTTLASFAILSAGVSGAAHSQRLEIVVPFSAGGGTDVIARTLADSMSKTLDQPVIVLNRPGGGTIIGSQHVARSKPDGSTLLVATLPFAVNPSLYRSVPYSAVNDFDPVAFIGASANVLVVNSSSPFKNVRDIIDYAKAHPGKLMYGSAGTGSSLHLFAALFETHAAVKLTHVPYKGGNPAATALLANEVNMVFAAAGVAQFIANGQMRAIAVTSTERSAAYPTVPTIAESGLPNYAAESWYGFVAPKGTPGEVIQKLNQAAAVAIRSELFQRRAEPEGLRVNLGSPQAFGEFIRKESEMWARVIPAAGIQQLD